MKLDIKREIKELKKEMNAVILAHNYQRGEVQDIADFVGDSLGLSFEAARTAAEVIVFCGVHFMAETAKILSPAKTVLLPDLGAGCPMADMIDAEKLRGLKAAHPKAKVLSYVNTSASVKAETDYCCTSANAVKVVQGALMDEEVIFVPDKYLAAHVSKQTGKEFIVWNGYCPTHVKITGADILKAKEAHPGAPVLTHPECTPEVNALADEVLSTEGLIRYAKASPANEFIIGTEVGIIHRLKKENPSKRFYPASDLAVCPNMKLTTLEKVLASLKEGKFEITLSEEIINKAKGSIDRMLEFV
ncbi:MAG: quinolinate synthase NadA [Actinomycetota bacterium]|nr:quinolinate synthase NadA [Actinomycetota bacterium]